MPLKRPPLNVEAGEWYGFRCPACGKEQPALASGSARPLEIGERYTCTGCGKSTALANTNTGRERG